MTKKFNKVHIAESGLIKKTNFILYENKQLFNYILKLTKNDDGNFITYI